MSGRDILWTPSPEWIEQTRLTGFMRWLAAKKGLEFDSYTTLWEWSVNDLDGFWSAICEHLQVPFITPPQQMLAESRQPGAVWCPGAEVNYVQTVARHFDRDGAALVTHSETFGRSEVSWRDLGQQVANCAANLRAMGVGQGDRVAAVLPNTEAAIIAFLAATSLGAVWSLCAPDMGHVAVLDRFRQIAPKVLIVQDGYVLAGKTIDRSDALAEVVGGLNAPNLVWLPVVGDVPEGATPWVEMLTGDATLEVTPVPFDHPLWVVYSSGTTGNPKPIVHGHGGVMMEGAKQGALHQDLRAGDVFSWLTSSGWIMWNVQGAALTHGCTVVLFDAAPNHPDFLALWRVAAAEKITYLGMGAPLITLCDKAGVRPADLDLSALRSMSTTGAPLTQDGYEWIYKNVKSDLWFAPVSGGTDVAAAFVGGCPTLPVRSGEMQCPYLGCAAYAFDELGNRVVGQVGELVITEPMPTMPLYFWGDEDGSRLTEAYYDTYPGIWRHGDWVEFTPEGGNVIYGRSDATLNRKGLRLGSSEIYRAVEALPEVADSLVVDLEFLGRDSFMPLFVVLAEGVTWSDDLKTAIETAIRTGVSPRFLPNEIVPVAEIPRTISGKKLEVPVKKLLLGGDPARVVNRDAMANPASFDTYIAYAQSRAASGAAP